MMGEKRTTVISYLWIWLFFKMASSQTSANSPRINLVFAASYDTMMGAVTGEVLKTYIKTILPDVNLGKVAVLLVKETDTEKEVCNDIIAGLSTGHTVLIDTTLSSNNITTSLVRQVARTLRLPYVCISPEWKPVDRSEHLVRFILPVNVVSYVVRHLTNRLALKSIGILHDRTFALYHKYSTLLENIATRQVFLQSSGRREDLLSNMKTLKKADIIHVFVLGSTEMLNKVLEVVEVSEIYGKEFTWFFITKDTKPLNLSSSNATFLVAQPELLDPSRRHLLNSFLTLRPTEEVDTAFYVDVAAMTVAAVSKAVREGNWSTTQDYPKCVSGITDGQSQDGLLVSALRKVSFSGMYGNFTVRQKKNSYQNLHLSLTKVVTHNGTVLDRKQIAIWEYSHSGGKLRKVKREELKSLVATTVYRATTVQQPPFVMKHDNGTFYGLCIDLMNEIKQLLGFEYVIHETEDGSFGALDDNHSWNGMIRELIDKKAHIALAPLSVMAEREAVVDFTKSFYELVGITILMKKPEDKSSIFKFVSVLDSNVWGCILAAYIITSVVLYLFDRLSPNSFHNNKDKQEAETDNNRDFNLNECFWFCMTSLTPQGGGEAPRNLSGRVVAASWWLFGFVIMASYTANLAAFLTVSRLDTPIKSLEDLANQYGMQYAPLSDSASMTYFKRMAHVEERFAKIWKDMAIDMSMNPWEKAKLAVWEYPISDKYTRMWRVIKYSGMPKTFTEGVRRVKESKDSRNGFAFIADSTDVDYAVLTNCDLEKVGSEFSRKPLAFAVQKGSPLKEQISSAILQLTYQRKVDILREKWWRKNPHKKDCGVLETQSTGIGINEIGGVFILIVSGVLLSFASLIKEYLGNKMKRITVK